MKKQLLIAAVAATMSAQALADISITGAASATFTATDFDATATQNTNVYAQDTDITITGTSGDTTVSTSIDLSDTGGASVGEVKMTTTLMGVDITITDDTSAGNASTNASMANVEFIASTDIAGITLTYEDSNTNRNGSIKAAMTIAGLDVSVKQAATATTTTVGGDMAGLTATYTNVSNDGVSKDTSSIVVSGSAGGVDLSVKSYSAESAAAATMDHDGDSNGYLDSNKGTILAATMDLGGNSVTVTSTDVQQSTSTSTISDKVSIAATRALASGADLTATFTNDTTKAKSTVALKIAVSF